MQNFHFIIDKERAIEKSINKNIMGLVSHDNSNLSWLVCFLIFTHYVFSFYFLVSCDQHILTDVRRLLLAFPDPKGELVFIHISNYFMILELFYSILINGRYYRFALIRNNHSFWSKLSTTFNQQWAIPSFNLINLF